MTDRVTHCKYYLAQQVMPLGITFTFDSDVPMAETPLPTMDIKLARILGSFSDQVIMLATRYTMGVTGRRDLRHIVNYLHFSKKNAIKMYKLLDQLKGVKC